MPRAEGQRSLETHDTVFTDSSDASAQIDTLGARGRGEEPGERPLEAPRQPRRLVGERKQVPIGARMQAAEERQDLVSDQAALRVRIRGVSSER